MTSAKRSVKRPLEPPPLEMHVAFDWKSMLLYYAARVAAHTLTILRYVIILLVIMTVLSIFARLGSFIDMLANLPYTAAGVAIMLLDSWIYAVILYFIVLGLAWGFANLYLDYLKSKFSELEAIFRTAPGALAVQKLVEITGVRNIYEFLAAANIYRLKRGEKTVYRLEVDHNTGTEFVVLTHLGGERVELPAAPLEEGGGEEGTEVYGSGGGQ